MFVKSSKLYIISTWRIDKTKTKEYSRRQMLLLLLLLYLSAKNMEYCLKSMQLNLSCVAIKNSEFALHCIASDPMRSSTNHATKRGSVQTKLTMLAQSQTTDPMFNVYGHLTIWFVCLFECCNCCMRWRLKIANTSSSYAKLCWRLSFELIPRTDEACKWFQFKLKTFWEMFCILCMIIDLICGLNYATKIKKKILAWMHVYIWYTKNMFFLLSVVIYQCSFFHLTLYLQLTIWILYQKF